MPGCDHLEDLEDLDAAGELVRGVTRALTGGTGVRAADALGGGVDAGALAVLLRQARAIEADTAALIAAIGARADVLAAEGRAAPAGEFLLDQGQVRARTARDEAARADVLGWAPEIAAAVGDGRVGADQLDSLARHTRHLDHNTRAQLPVTDLVADAGRLPADTFDAAVRHAVRAANPGEADASAERQRAASEFRHWRDERTGMGRFSGALDLERYETLTTAIDRETRRLANTAEEPTARDANLAAAALVELVTGSTGGGGPSRAQISVVVDVDTLAAARAGDHSPHLRPGRTGNGHELTNDALARLSCDAELRRVVLDKHNLPINVGRSHRTATNAQWTALRAIHTTCAWPGCTQPINHCQIHHVQPWATGGPTNLNNLLPLCSQHHHRVHDGKWHLRLHPDRTIDIRQPDGVRHKLGGGSPGPDPPSIRAGPARI